MRQPARQTVWVALLLISCLTVANGEAVERAIARNAVDIDLLRALLAVGSDAADRYRAVASHSALNCQDAEVRTSWEAWAKDAYQADLLASEAGYAEGRLLLSRGHSTRESDTEVAAQYFARAAQVGSDQTRFEAQLWLAVLASEAGKPVRLLLPTRQADAETSMALPNAPTDHGYVLDALLVDEDDLRLGVPVHILAVWRDTDADRASPEKASVETWHGGEWLVVDQTGYRYTLGEVANMVRDGAFARVLSPRAGPPVGFRPLYRRQTADDCGLGSWGATQGLALRICGRESTAVGVASIPVSINAASGLFLLHGRYQTAGASQPRIGVRYAPPSQTDAWAGKTRYVVRTPSSDWSRFVEVLEPPMKTDHVSVWAVELSTASCLFVDDLGLFPIPRPTAFDGDNGASNGAAGE